MSSKLPIVVLISGRGSNLQVLIDACKEEDYPAEITGVISNKPDAPGLMRAKEAELPFTIINHKEYPSRELFDRALHASISAYSPELVCLAGFMRVLTPEFVHKWAGKLVNTHPSLLPAFKGTYGHYTHEAVLDSGAKVSGSTLHFVTAEVDGGPIAMQSVVAVEHEDTVESLEAKVLATEHQMYPAFVRAFAEGRVRLENDKAWINDVIT